MYHYATTAVVMLMSLLGFVSPAAAAKQGSIFVIYSYSIDHPFSRVAVDKIRQELGVNYEVYVEHLDTKRFSEASIFEYQGSVIAEKLEKIDDLAVVITFDDNALIFADQFRDALFPDVPIVFVGVNSRDRVIEMSKKDKITGYLEGLSIDKTLALAAQLNPEPLTEVVALVDDTRTSQYVLNLIETALTATPEVSLSTIDLSRMTFRDARVQFGAQTDPSTVLIWGGAYRDKTGAAMGMAEIAAYFGEAAGRPFYTLTDVQVHSGALGGHVISAHEMAENAIDTARRILNGEDPNDIPTVFTSPNLVVIDEPRARRYGLRLDRLGPEAQVLRPRPPFLVRHWAAVIAAAQVFAVMGLLVVALIFYLNRRARLGLTAMNAELSAKNAELQEAHSRLEHHSLHDALTGLPNRRYYERRIFELAADGPADRVAALFTVDVDRFKAINDTLGHIVGDKVLVSVASIIRSAAPEDVFVARIGGDEFVLIGVFDDIGAAEALGAALAQAMRTTLHLEGAAVKISGSIGIAAVAAGEPLDPLDLIRRSDAALYLVKERGRDGSALYRAGLDSAELDRQRLHEDIARGVAAGEFEPFFQTQVDARSGAIVGVEALARWRHPTKGVLSPPAFLSAAQKIGMLAEIDRLILEKSVAHLTRWQAAGFTPDQLSINVSAERLVDGPMLSSVWNLDLGRTALCFEILESVFLDAECAASDAALTALRELGVRLEIDDFGTGHASILALRRLRPHRLKIARELVAPIGTDPSQAELIGAIVDIGRSLGVAITAEGVETEPQANALRALGVEVFQGYFFSRPCPADEMLAHALAAETAAPAAMRRP